MVVLVEYASSDPKEQWQELYGACARIVFDVLLPSLHLSPQEEDKMLSLSPLLGFTLLWVAANCNPTPVEALDQLSGQKTFSLEQVEVGVKEPLSLAEEISRTYLKYGVDPPLYVEAAVRAGGPGQTSVPVKSIGGDKEYLMSVQVGNHNLTLDLDTGSADL
jgi:hypothetical protein